MQSKRGGIQRVTKQRQADTLPQADTSSVALLEQHAVVLGDALGDIRQQWVGAPAQATLLPGGVDEGQVGELGVHRDTHHLEVKSRKPCWHSQPVNDNNI